MSFVNINGGSVIAPSFIAYLAYTIPADGTIQLNWPSQFVDNPNNVASIMDITATAGGANGILRLPTATAVGPGQTSLIVNVGAQPFDVQLFDNNALVTINAGESYYIYLVDNTTPAGVWRITTIPGAPVVTSVGAITVGATAIANMVISNSPIINNGNLGFAFQGDLAAILGLSTTGFAVRTAANAWALRSIAGTVNQINVTNGDGVAGNPTISLANNITITTLTAGNIAIGVSTPNTISSTNANGNIVLNPNGTGAVNIEANLNILPLAGTSRSINFFADDGINGISFAAGNRATILNLIWPTTNPTAGQVLTFLGGTALTWSNVPSFSGVSTSTAIARYLNNAGSLQNSNVLLDNLDNITGVRSITSTNIASTNGLIIGGQITPERIATIGGNLILAPVGIFQTVSNAHIVIQGNNGAPGTLFFNNVGNTNFTALSCNNATAAGATFSLPSADAAANSLMMTDGGTNWRFTATTAGNSTANAAGVAKAWAVFNGALASPIATKNNYNVANITKTGVGNYVVNFATALSSVDYAVSITSNGVNTNVPFTAYYTTKTTGALTFFLWDTTGAALADASDISVVCTIQ